MKRFLKILCAVESERIASPSWNVPITLAETNQASLTWLISPRLVTTSDRIG